MNETIQTLISRRSIRKYKAEQIPESDLQQILEAGMYAASGMGIQPVTMVVVQDKETIAKLTAMNAKIMGTDSDPMYGAPTIVVVLADMEKIGQRLVRRLPGHGQPHERRRFLRHRLVLDQPGQRRI